MQFLVRSFRIPLVFLLFIALDMKSVQAGNSGASSRSLSLLLLLPACFGFHSKPPSPIGVVRPTDRTVVRRWSSVPITTKQPNDGLFPRKSSKRNTFVAPFEDEIEHSRQNRRIIFTHKDWTRHRDQNRLFRHMQTINQSIIYKNIARPVRYVTYITTFLVLYNGLVRTLRTWNALQHVLPILYKLPAIGLPMDPFVLSSPMLGLLLGTREAIR
jgi:hypothetical protein